MGHGSGYLILVDARTYQQSKSVWLFAPVKYLDVTFLKQHQGAAEPGLYKQYTITHD